MEDIILLDCIEIFVRKERKDQKKKKAKPQKQRYNYDATQCGIATPIAYTSKIQLSYNGGL